MATWIFEPGHTEAEFRARHTMVTWVRGLFKDIHGQLELDSDRWLEATFEGEIDATGIWTGQLERDEHLRSADFFDVENHPTMTFTSTGVRQVDGALLLEGDLTIRGVTKPVTFELEASGFGPDAYGGTRCGFSAQTSINRMDYGVAFNGPIPGVPGGVAVSENVNITLEIEGVLQS